MQKRSSVFKKIGLALGALLLLLVAIYVELVVYGLRQGWGQAKILWYAKPVEEFIADPAYPDGVRPRYGLRDWRRTRPETPAFRPAPR